VAHVHSPVRHAQSVQEQNTRAKSPRQHSHARHNTENQLPTVECDGDEQRHESQHQRARAAAHHFVAGRPYAQSVSEQHARVTRQHKEEQQQLKRNEFDGISPEQQDQHDHPRDEREPQNEFKGHSVPEEKYVLGRDEELPLVRRSIQEVEENRNRDHRRVKLELLQDRERLGKLDRERQERRRQREHVRREEEHQYKNELERPECIQDEARERESQHECSQRHCEEAGDSWAGCVSFGGGSLVAPSTRAAVTSRASTASPSQGRHSETQRMVNLRSRSAGSKAPEVVPEPEEREKVQHWDRRSGAREACDTAPCRTRLNHMSEAGTVEGPHACPAKQTPRADSCGHTRTFQEPTPTSPRSPVFNDVQRGTSPRTRTPPRANSPGALTFSWWDLTRQAPQVAPALPTGVSGGEGGAMDDSHTRLRMQLSVNGPFPDMEPRTEVAALHAPYSSREHNERLSPWPGMSPGAKAFRQTFEEFSMSLEDSHAHWESRGPAIVWTGASIESRAAQARKAEIVEVANTPCQFKDQTQQNDRHDEHSSRVESLEIKCHDLEMQLQSARRTEMVLRQELLGAQLANLPRDEHTPSPSPGAAALVSAAASSSSSVLAAAAEEAQRRVSEVVLSSVRNACCRSRRPQ